MYDPITAPVAFGPVTASILLIFAALAGLLVTLAGGRLLLSAINVEDGDDEDDDEQDDEEDENYG